MITPKTPAGRIRWTDEPRTSTGYVGEIEPHVFQIWGSSDGMRWMLLSSLPGTVSKQFEGTDLAELKAEAERWLEQFAASLGAVFLEDIEPLRATPAEPPKETGQ
jgi:hypothetical protein